MILLCPPESISGFKILAIFQVVSGFQILHIWRGAREKALDYRCTFEHIRSASNDQMLLDFRETKIFLCIELFYAFYGLRWLPLLGGGGSVGPNPHFTLASYVLHAQKHRPQAIKNFLKKKSWWHFSPLWNQKGSSTSIISAKLKGKDEEEKKNTHTHTYTHLTTTYIQGFWRAAIFPLP